MEDSDGFLIPPPASTLLIRRTRTNSTGSSTYVVASPPSPSSSSSAPATPGTSEAHNLPSDFRRSLSLPHRRLQKKPSRDRRSDHSFKRVNFDNNKVNVLLTPQSTNPNPNVKISVSSGGGLHHRSSFPPISPLAIDPSHALSVTLSSDRSISTVVPIDSVPPSSTPTEFQFPPPLPPVSSSSSVSTPEVKNSGESNTDLNLFHPPPPSPIVTESDEKPKGRGKPAAFTSEAQASTSGKSGSIGKEKLAAPTTGKRKRGERGPDRFPNIDPATGRRRYIRKKRFTLDKRTSSRARLQSRLHSDSFVSYDHELTGKWRPTDDLRLIVNVLQTNDLDLVHRGVKFSCKFTLENIERRWAGLLYDKAIAKVSQNTMRTIHPRMVAQIHEKSLFSAEEDRVLKTLRSTLDPKTMTPVMEKLLKDHALVFLKWRTSKCLIEHWMHLREYHLLCDQNVKDYFDQESFSEFEDNLTEQEVRDNYEIDSNVRREMLIENRNTKKMIRVLEEEVSRWQVMADMVTEIPQTPFEEGSFAMLRGKQVRYLMRSREITLGRRTAESMSVDADLSLEGSTYKVSRRQATIQLRPMGDFAIWNQGKHGIYVDGNVVIPGKLGVLVDQSVIEISQLRFVFLINHKMVTEQRKRLIRLEVKKEMVRLSKIARFIKNHPTHPMSHPSHPFMGSPGSNRVGASSTASSTIDNVASNSSGTPTSTTSAVPSTSRFSGSLTRPPQPSSKPSTSTTFVRPYVPPLPSTSSYIPRTQNLPSVFRKPAAPPSINTSTRLLSLQSPPPVPPAPLLHTSVTLPPRPPASTSTLNLNSSHTSTNTNLPPFSSISSSTTSNSIPSNISNSFNTLKHTPSTTISYYPVPKFIQQQPTTCHSIQSQVSPSPLTPNPAHPQPQSLIRVTQSLPTVVRSITPAPMPTVLMTLPSQLVTTLSSQSPTSAIVSVHAPTPISAMNLSDLTIRPGLPPPQNSNYKNSPL